MGTIIYAAKAATKEVPIQWFYWQDQKVFLKCFKGYLEIQKDLSYWYEPPTVSISFYSLTIILL